MQREGGRLLKCGARGRGLEGRGKLAGESGESRQDPSCHIRTNTQFDPLTRGEERPPGRMLRAIPSPH